MTAPAPLLFENVRLIDPADGLDAVGALLVADGRIVERGTDAGKSLPEGTQRIDGKGAVLAPGLVDMRVFTGEPGAEHRETLSSAGDAAAAGGVTTLVLMPDAEPVIDDIALVDFIARRAQATAPVNIVPTAAATRGLNGVEMAELRLLTDAGAVALSNGRKPITNAQVMRRILTYARDFGALLIHQPEDPDLKGSGVMNAGETATRAGLAGIPHEAETIMLERDMRLVRLTGGRYHAAQLSAAESAGIVRAAKANGLDVTAGVSINHLCLNENDIGTWRSFLKMSPPLRTEDDRRALIAALADGTIDVIVSAHDPQDVEMKRHPFAEAADGATGLETLLAAGLRLVHSGDLTLSRLIAAMTLGPARILGLDAGTLQPGRAADLVLFDPDAPWICDRKQLRSRSKNTPFHGARFQGRVLMTTVAGRIVHS
ncbi:MAG: dihydroorotase [Hyphomicrobiaceae bacterium]|nr:dihydroorotase [Hyphomicrobiaceae bacterium]